jgi:hypothetical protein
LAGLVGIGTVVGLGTRGAGVDTRPRIGGVDDDDFAGAEPIAAAGACEVSPMLLL